MTEIADLSTTDASNTTITSADIREDCLPSGINNAIRNFAGMVARWTSSDTIASATTTDIGAQPEAYLTVSGTTTITGFGTVRAGTIRYLRFSGALTLTHNATSLILPGAANITTAAGDTAVFVSEGSGNWRCLAYQYAGGVVLTTAAASSAAGMASEETGGYVRANVVKYSPGVAKCWVHCGVTGNIFQAYNVSSVTDNGAGDVTVNQSVTMSANNGPILGTAFASGGLRTIVVNAYTTTSFTAFSYNAAAAKSDPSEWFLARYGAIS